MLLHNVTHWETIKCATDAPLWLTLYQKDWKWKFVVIKAANQELKLKTTAYVHTNTFTPNIFTHI
jgi:hypothetical protein